MNSSHQGGRLVCLRQITRGFANSILAVLTLWGATGCRTEGRFPDRPITLICPWSAGGGTDRVSRQLAAQLETELRVPVNVINATGGGGVTGHTRGARARPDGYTLTMITVELSMLHWRGLTNLTHQDFAPIRLLNRDAAALFVSADSRFGSINDLAAAVAESSRAKLKASGTAFGGIWHIAVAGWLNSQGLDPNAINWISINGAGPAIQELLAGGVDFICCSLPEADAVLSGGQVRCLGVMADERVPGFEDVATFHEQGHDWSIAGWRGIAAPRETPGERLEVLATAIERVTRSEPFSEFMDASGFNVSYESPEAFSRTLLDQDRLFGEILTQPSFRKVSGEHFGPLMFPGLIAFGLLVTLSIVIRDIFRGRGPDRSTSDGVGSESSEPTSSARSGDRTIEVDVPPGISKRWSPLAVLLAIVIYCGVSETVGFIIAAIFMLGGLLIFLRLRFPASIAVAVFVSLMAYQVFGVMLRVPLPRGFLEW